MLNKVILIGRLTRDPETRTTQSGLTVVSFTLAVDRRFKNAQGEREADFIRCKAWRQTAEFISKYFDKGNKIAVVGSIETGSYDDKNGNRVFTTEVNVDEAYFVETRQAQAQTFERENDTFDDGKQMPEDEATQDDTSLPFDL